MLNYALAAALVAALVAAAGAAITGGEPGAGILFGAGFGLLLQLPLFWMFLAGARKGQLWLAYSGGVFCRFAGFAAVALVAVPAAGLAPAPTLFTLAAVLWLTTLIEPFSARGVVAEPAP